MSDTWRTEELWRCIECSSVTRTDDLLTARNPFIPEELLTACPTCKGLDFTRVCDREGCASGTSCGTPTDSGYRRTCGKHRPNRAGDRP